MTQDDTHYHYPHATQAARQFANVLDGKFDTVSPLTEVATVADTSFHLATGYVQATGRKGPIQVIGVPPYTVVPGMDIFVRQMTRSGVSQYVFDGYAPATLNMRTNSGSVIVTTQAGPPAQSQVGVTHGGTGVPIFIPAFGGGRPNVGWFWSFFFYMSALPPPPTPCCLYTITGMTQPLAGLWNPTYQGFRILYDARGRLGTDIDGRWTKATFAPHKVWFLVLQVSNGLMVNGLQIGNMNQFFPTQDVFPYTQISHTIMSAETIISSSAGTETFSAVPPSGSWVSKFAFGCSTNAAGTLPVWPYAPGSIPTNDSQIVQGNAAFGTGLSVVSRHLFSDNILSDPVNFPTAYQFPDTGTANQAMLLVDDTRVYSGNGYGYGAYAPQGPY